MSVQTETILSCQKFYYQVDDIYEFYGHRWTEHEDDELGVNMHNIENMEVEVSQNDSQNETSEKDSMGSKFKCNV